MAYNQVQKMVNLKTFNLKKFENWVPRENSSDDYIGLNNVGNTCYINSAIQMYTGLKKIIRGF